MTHNYAASVFQFGLAGAGAPSGEVTSRVAPPRPILPEPGAVPDTHFVHRAFSEDTPGSFARTVKSLFGLASDAATDLLRERGDSGASRVHNLVNDVLTSERKALDKIAELAAETATANWDGEGGQPIDARQWDDARSIVSLAVRELLGVPAPFVSACGDGTAHLQWTTRRGNRGVIEIGKQGYWWSFVPMSDGDGEDEIVQLRSPDEAFQKIRSIFR